MTPSDIEVLLFFYTTCEREHPRYDAPAIKSTIKMFVDANILEPAANPDNRWLYVTTPKGKALVQALCDTPFPVQRWADPRTNKLIPLE